MTVVLTKVQTQVVWRSPDPSDKTVSIPGSVPANKGYDLDIGATIADGSTYTVTPDSGTIDGQPNFTFTLPPNETCNLSLRSDADNADWIIRCLCCVPSEIIPPPLPVPPGPSLQYERAVNLTKVVSPAVPTGALTVSTTHADDVVFLHVALHTEGPATTGDNLPVVTNISDTSGLTWTRLMRESGVSSTFGYLFGPTYDDVELWWAHAPSVLTNDVITITVTSNLGYLVASFIGVSDSPHPSSPFVLNGSLPSSAKHIDGLSGVPTTPQLTGISVDERHDLSMVYLTDFATSPDAGLMTAVLPNNQVVNYNATTRAGGLTATSPFIALIVSTDLHSNFQNLDFQVLDNATIHHNVMKSSWVMMSVGLRGA